ncbi:MAG: VanW family protein [Nitriliruptoraceae bacterium]
MTAAPNAWHHWGQRTAEAFLLAVMVMLAVVVVTLLMQAGRILPGTDIDGLDVSGLTRQEATRQLTKVTANRSERVANVTFADVTHTITSSEADVRVDVAATVKSAYEQGRGSFWSFLTRPYALFTSTSVPLTFTYDQAQLTQFVTAVAASHDQPMVDGSLEIGTARPWVKLVTPQVGVDVQPDELAALTVALLTGAKASPQPVPAVQVRPRLSVAHTTHLASALETVLAKPQSVTIHTSSVTFTPAELAQLLTLVEEPSANGAIIVRVVIDPASLPRQLIAIAKRHARSPEPARFLSPERPAELVRTLGDLTVKPLPYTVQVIPPRDGLLVDSHDLAQQLAVAVSNAQPQLQLALRTLPAPPPERPLEEVRPTHLLATFTSPLVAGQTRNLNISRLAETLDERVILPGESFSINEISGPRRCADGYVPAGIIFNGELVEACGGGVSQVGTTVLNAAFFAGVQLDAFTPHSFYIGRYSPGREATLSYPRLDVAFTNTTPAAIHMRTSTTPTSLTVSLYGQPAFAQVQAVHGPRVKPRPFTEERRLDPDLPPDTERVLQSGGSGFTITVTRIMTSPDGTEQSERFTTRYLPRRRIVAYNPPVKAPTPPPDDEPEDETDVAESPNSGTEAAPSALNS